MSRVLPLAALASLLWTSAVAAQDGPLAERIDAAVQRFAPDIIEIRHRIHQNPELGNREFETAALVAEHLRGLGFDRVETGIAHTGVVGILTGGRPGPVVAVRADMDALPVTEDTPYPFRSTVRTTYLGQEVGVSHACGHDIHTAVQLGVASVLASIRDELPGTIKFIFQPAEEGPPPGITIRGQQSHGAAPHVGVDPVVMAAQAIMALQTIRSRNLPPLEPSVVTVGIVRGGERFNIIPMEVYLEGTVRSYDPDVRDAVERRMGEILAGITAASGGSFELDYARGTPATINDPALSRRMAPSLARVVGTENVRVLDPTMGGEDFAYFANELPGFFFRLGTVKPGTTSGGHHTPTFMADDASVPVGMRVMSNVLMDFLSGPVS